MAGDSLFNRIGGKAAVSAAVDVFYKKVLADATLAPFFKGVSMERQRAKQVAFLTYAFGGSPNYDGKSMWSSHASLIRNQGLGLAHFNRVAELLLDTLIELGVPQPIIEEVGELVLTLEPIFDPAKYDENVKKYEKDEGKTPSLYERIGGAAAVNATVESFYKKVLADPILAPYFEGVAMDKQIKKQVSFISYAFGGGPYTGRDLVASHRKMIKEQGLGLKHFDAVAGHLVKTMTELGVPQPLIDEAAAIVMSTRPIFDPSNPVYQD